MVNINAKKSLANSFYHLIGQARRNHAEHLFGRQLKWPDLTA